jgi:peptidoglycan/xylan/chitin deacetylase (PgdA/CDA1 family)
MTAIQVCRNFVCGVLALALIASGRVRRARKRALSDGVITAIYFHGPNRRLFRKCTEWLTRQGYTFISADELWEALSGKKPFPRGAVWLSFDDTCRSLLENVLPLVESRRIPVTLFAPSGIVEGDGLFSWRAALIGGRNAMTPAELKRAALIEGVTIGSHTVTHAHMARCSDEELARETCDSRQALEALTGGPVHYFAYPYGELSGREREHLIRAGYRFAATIENALVTPDADPYLVPRFAVANSISFPEAICNMVGVWQPAIARFKKTRAPRPAASKSPEIPTYHGTAA